jgi:hypothetical protein
MGMRGNSSNDLATTLEGGRDFVGKLLLGLDPAGPE